MGIFKWLGKLFIGQAKDAAATIVQDEIHKVHDEIASAISDKLGPLLTSLPEADQKAILEHGTDIAKQAAVAYAEAYINAHMPTIPALPPTTAPTAS